MSDDTPNPETSAGLPAAPSDTPPPPTDPQKPYRVRHDGWTVQRQNDFMEALGRTGCVRDAARVAGISWNSAYKFRERDADFAERWERALRRAKTPLGEVAWKRAVEGEKQDVWYHGKVVGQRVKHANDVLRLLIQRDDNGAGRDAAGRFAPAGAGGRFAPAGSGGVGTDGHGSGVGRAAGHQQNALPAPEEDEGPIPLPRGPTTMDNLDRKLKAMVARSHEYGNRNINIKTGERMTDEVIEAVQRFLARGRVQLPQEFEWISADRYDDKEVEFLAQHPGGVPEDGKH